MNGKQSRYVIYNLRIKTCLSIQRKMHNKVDGIRDLFSIEVENSKEYIPVATNVLGLCLPI